MRSIQFLLVLVFVMTVVIYFSRWRSRLRDRMLLLFFAVVSSLVVLFPNITSSLAGLAGVGRGVDFIIYLAIAGLSFFSFLLYAQLREMDRRFTEFTRAIALKTAQDKAEP